MKQTKESFNKSNKNNNNENKLVFDNNQNLSPKNKNI